MAIIKCKMCGGDLQITEGMTTAECEYCGSLQTVPAADNEKKLNLFFRANKLRAACEFDRAAGVYESIVAEFPGEAEAYWGLILCKYGIEYVDDPATGKKIPTCHRSSFDSVMDDSNFDMVMECGDVVARKVYREEAKAIEELRKSIIEISGKEEPYDIFISYKDTDDAGQRTVDSVIAQDVYEALTAKGYRVFFSRISLEDKLGTEYEPYIFAALNSAKIMLVFGTDYEHFNAVWVKNEWSRYLQLMTKDKNKHLIPCFKGIDAYDMPKEFQKLSAQDMGKVGAMQDLLRGVGKILPKEEKKAEAASPVVQQVVQGGGPNVAALVKRGNMALEVKDFAKAEEFFDRALDMDAECGEAYLGKFLLVLKFSRLEDMAQRWVYGNNENIAFPENAKVNNTAGENEIFHANSVPGYLSAEEIQKKFHFDDSYSSELKMWEMKLDTVQKVFGTTDFKRVEQYATGELKQKVDGAKQNVLDLLNEKIANAKKQDAEYIAAVRSRYNAYLETFAKQAATMRTNAEAQREREYQEAVGLFENAHKASEYRKVRGTFEQDRIKFYKESQNYIQLCKERVSEIECTEERLKKEKRKERISKIKKAFCFAVAAAIVFLVVTKVIIPAVRYNQAETLLQNGESDAAVAIFDTLGEYKDAQDIAGEHHYNNAKEYLESDDIVGAAMEFGKAKDYMDARNRSLELWSMVRKRSVISAARTHSVALYNDGRVGTSGEDYEGQRSVRGWDDIVSVSAGWSFTAGLKTDGTVVVTNGDWHDKYWTDSDSWSDIVEISSGSSHIVGLKNDGTVIASGFNGSGACDVEEWSDVAAVSAGYSMTVGLKTDGTVVLAGENYKRKYKVNDWKDIISVYAGYHNIVGLKADGTVVVVGDDSYGQCNVSDWTNIVAISAGVDYVVGLKSDGTVVAVGKNDSRQCNVSNMTDIVAISAGNRHVLGVKSDGTLAGVGRNEYGERSITYNAKDIKLPN